MLGWGNVPRQPLLPKVSEEAENKQWPEPRPLEGPGLIRRVAPFVAAASLAFGAIPFTDINGPAWEMIGAALLLVAIVTSIFAVPWSRLPADAQAIPALLYLIVVVMLRDATGGTASVFTPLLVLPPVWFSLYGNRHQLIAGLAGFVAALVLPPLIIGGTAYPDNDYATALVLTIIVATLGLTVQELVRSIRDRGEESRSILESALESFVSTDTDGRITEWNRQAEADFGYSREEAVGRLLAETILPERHRESYWDLLKRHLAGEETGILDRRFEVTVRRRDESEFPVEMSVVPVQTATGVHFNGFMHDISERRAAASHLQDAEERFRRAFDDAAIGMALVSPDGRWLRVNHALCEITGYPIEKLTGMQFRQITHPEDRGRDRKAMTRLLTGDLDRFQAERRYFHADGHVIWISVSVSTIRDSDDEPLYLISQMQDISERREAEKRLAYQASHDPLTDLPNRALLDERITNALAGLRHGQLPLAVLFLDLDRFKLVNDSFGHDAGDRLLGKVSERLQGLIRPSDTVARLGGDEFAILCEEMSPDAAASLARRIGSALSEPFGVEGREVVVSSSIGIAINSDANIAPGTLLANADAAMYEAKMRGRSGFAFFATEMRTRAGDRLAMEAELRAAGDAGQLLVHYQPQVDLRSGRVTGVEAFARWDHPERGLLPAAEFIPIAEESDLVAEIGAFVFEQAIRQAVRWRANGSPDLTMTVNVSSRQLAGPELPVLLSEALASTDLPPAALCVEMNESAVAEDPETAIEVMTDIKDLGIFLAIDEFGLGSSSLGLMRRMPALDVLKIDPSFVTGLDGDNGDERAVTDVILSLAHAFEMRTIAEGVETADQAQALRELNCDAAQGNHLSAPAAPEEIEVLLSAMPAPA
jgi:diguanylate cyclase (GGDEF)-like protein/PAS domain S-box-containing protein